MGGSSSSPRDLTIQDDVTGGAVKVSEAVAHRLVGEPEPVTEAVPTHNVETEPELREEINELQTRYEKRIKALEQHNKDLHHVSTDEFSKAVGEVEKKFAKMKPSKPICEELKTAVMECYQNNPKQTLLCGQIVKEYQACVQEQREVLLTGGGEDCQPCMLAQMARGPCGMHFMKAYDCYIDDGADERCGLLYLEMKECWDAHPNHNYQKIVDKAYQDIPTGTQKASKTKQPETKDSPKPTAGTKAEKTKES